MIETKLYECKVGSATYWVAALHANHAHELLYVVGEEMGADAEDFEEAKIVELAEAQGLKVNTDTGRGTVPLWELFLESAEPRIIACSEWP